MARGPTYRRGRRRPPTRAARSPGRPHRLRIISLPARLLRRRRREAAAAAATQAPALEVAAEQAAAPRLEQLVDQADTPPDQEPDDEPPTGG